MNVSLYQAAAAMNANSRWQELISQNLASSSLPGFKKQELSFDAIQAGVMPSSAGQPAPAILMPRTTGATNLTPGEVNPTGVKTDLAIEGPGFFEVQLPNGQHGYTRDGEFQINAQNQLVTKQGYPVMGESGPLQLTASNPAPLTIAPTGEVSQGSDVKGKIKLVTFNDPHRLTAIGAGYFEAEDPKLVAGNAQGSVLRQGYLENANMLPTTEMANLITSLRMFEANQKVMTMQDDRMGRIITDLGTPA